LIWFWKFIFGRQLWVLFFFLWWGALLLCIHGYPNTKYQIVILDRWRCLELRWGSFPFFLFLPTRTTTTARTNTQLYITQFLTTIANIYFIILNEVVFYLVSGRRALHLIDFWNGERPLLIQVKSSSNFK
jgi:hypothetical protein